LLYLVLVLVLKPNYCYWLVHVLVVQEAVSVNNNTALSVNMNNYHFVQVGDWHAKHQSQLTGRKQCLKASVEVRNQVHGKRLTHACEVVLFLDCECTLVNPDIRTQIINKQLFQILSQVRHLAPQKIHTN